MVKKMRFKEIWEECMSDPNFVEELRLQDEEIKRIIKEEEMWEKWVDRYAAEECNMRNPEVVVSLLRTYSIRYGDCQVGVLMHQAAKMIETKA